MSRSIRLTLIFGLLSLMSTITSATLIIHELNGQDWSVFDSNRKSASIPSKVPGSIYSDLRRSDVLDEELYKDFNDIKYRWVSYVNWTFVKSFDVDSQVLDRDQVYLVCHGLDTVSNVTLNGHLLGATDNMFVRYKWPVKSLLKAQQNVIQISFQSAPQYARKYFLDTISKKYAIPPVCPPESQRGECHPNFIRKMQASFSWDWGPAFPTQGIWQPITIEAYDKVLIRSITINTTPEHSGQWLLNATIWLESRKKNNLKAKLTLQLDGKVLTSQDFNCVFDSNGECPVKVFQMIPLDFNIKPWYPNGMGEQTLYRLNAIVETGQNSVSKEISIGFRTIDLIQERLNSVQESYSFYFQINGLPIFSKGSNWIPAHVLPENVSKEYLAYLLWSAKMANMNMLRVWGGGIYETDFFYELADKFGILIWQDMMFACALYPTDPKFLSSVSKEVRQQIRRLQHHPSIALWAGNNENEVAIVQMWWPEIPMHLADYQKDYLQLYIGLIEPIVAEEDTTRPYVSSSPSNHGRKIFTSNPQDPRSGDAHVYLNNNVWNWKSAPSAKFVSEYGFQSLPSLSLLQKYLSEQYLRYPFNEGLDHRQHKIGGTSQLLAQIQESLPLPSNSTGSIRALDDFIYLSQIFHAMAIKIQTEFYRRNRKVDPQTGEGFTMGALYWQLNNIWPGFSWTSIEYEGKWKMLHYFAKRMFDNVLVDVFQDEDHLKVIVVRDDYSDWINFSISINVYDWSQPNAVYTDTTTCLADPFNVTLAYKESIQRLLQRARCSNANRCFVQVELNGMINGQKIKRDNFVILGKWKDARLEKNPRIKLEKISGPSNISGSYVYDLELSTDKIAAFVWLDFSPTSDMFGVFSDNGFLMIKNITIQIRTMKNIAKDKLINNLLIKTLNDIQ